MFFEQSIPAGSKFNFSPTASDGVSTYFLDGKVTQANYVPGQFGDDTITGEAVNPQGVAINGPISADGFCFDPSGTLTSVFPGFISGNGGLAPGASGSYSISLFISGISCPTYLVGSSGFGTP